MDFRYIIKNIVIIFIVVSFILLISSNNIILEDNTIEGFYDTSIIVNKSGAFCELHRGSSGALDKSCGKLTNTNCNSTSCCVWTSDEKCHAGGAQGPTFNTESNGKTKSHDYYYFQKKCYGTGCPTVV